MSKVIRALSNVESQQRVAKGEENMKSHPMARTAQTTTSGKMTMAKVAERVVELGVNVKMNPAEMETYVLQFLPFLGLPEATSRLLATSLVELETFKRLHGADCPILPLPITPRFDRTVLSYLGFEWRFRNQDGPLKTLLTALENTAWRVPITLARNGQVDLAPSEVRLEPEQVQGVAKELRIKTKGYLRWHAANDGRFEWEALPIPSVSILT